MWFFLKQFCITISFQIFDLRIKISVSGQGVRTFYFYLLSGLASSQPEVHIQHKSTFVVGAEAGISLVT